MGKGYIDLSATTLDCEVNETAKIYKNVMLKNCVIGARVSVGDDARLFDSSVGEGTVIHRGMWMFSSRIGRYASTSRNINIWHCTIGNFCSIAWNVSIGGGVHDYTRVTSHPFVYSNDFGIMPKEHQPYDRFSDKCEIGNDVWIAPNAYIQRGVVIGDGAVVGAGAIVTHDVEPYTIVAGVPARPIKKRFSDDIIELLLKSRWWDLPTEVIKANFELFNMQPDKELALRLCALAEEQGA